MSLRYGNTWLATSTDTYIITNSNADDLIIDGGNSLSIQAGGGNDQIWLGGGSDQVWAGTGNDTIHFNGRGQYGQASGQSGADTFYIHENFSGHMTISDFNSREGDRIKFEKDPVDWHSVSLGGGKTGMVHEFADGSSVTVVGQTYASLYSDMAKGWIIDV